MFGATDTYFIYDRKTRVSKYTYKEIHQRFYQAGLFQTVKPSFHRNFFMENILQFMKEYRINNLYLVDFKMDHIAIFLNYLFKPSSLYHVAYNTMFKMVAFSYLCSPKIKNKLGF